MSHINELRTCFSEKKKTGIPRKETAPFFSSGERKLRRISPNISSSFSDRLGLVGVAADRYRYPPTSDRCPELRIHPIAVLRLAAQSFLRSTAACREEKAASKVRRPRIIWISFQQTFHFSVASVIGVLDRCHLAIQFIRDGQKVRSIEKTNEHSLFKIRKTFKVAGCTFLHHNDFLRREVRRNHPFKRMFRMVTVLIFQDRIQRYRAFVDPTNSPRRGQFLNFGFDQIRDEIFARWVPPYGSIQDPSVHVSGLGKRNQPQFGELHLISYDGDIALSPSSCVGLDGVAFTLEPWRVGMFFEKAVEGITKVAQG